jgi:hypothetical protein
MVMMLTENLSTQASCCWNIEKAFVVQQAIVLLCSAWPETHFILIDKLLGAIKVSACEAQGRADLHGQAMSP